jgi:glutamate/tyrosine decarboxylase-like PLP-dependent enzyme
MADSSLVDRIRAAEALSRHLEPDAGTRAAVREGVIEYSEAFLESLPERKAYEIDKSSATQLWSSPISDEPEQLDEVLALVERAVDTPGINPASAGHLGYIPGGGVYYASLGDHLAAVTNRYVGVRFAGPGAVEMENVVLDWARQLVGYPDGFGGVLLPGGTVANLTAIVAAREAHGLKARDYERAVVYGSAHVHHCIDKSLHVIGMGECVQRRIGLDDRYRMRPDELAAAIEDDRKVGLRPWLVVGTAGTTDLGVIDPLDEVGAIARDHDLWYHVDAAYGGFFALCPELRARFDGMERSDSIVLDPHKGLFLPFGTGAVLVRDKGKLLRAFRYTGEYMQDTLEEEATAQSSPGDLSPEFSRHFRGPRAWLPLKLLGVGPFRACLEEKHLLARYFHREVQKLGFEVGPEPDLSVVAYRFVPEEGDPDAFNRNLLEAIHRDGRVFVSSTTLAGHFVLRVAVLSFRTRLETIDLYLRILREKVEEMTGGALRNS